jgi:hypothetical protein
MQALQARRIKVCTLDSTPRLRDCAATAAAVVRLELVEPSVVTPEASGDHEAGTAGADGSGTAVQRLKATPGVARALLAWAAARAIPPGRPSRLLSLHKQHTTSEGLLVVPACGPANCHSCC